MPTERKPPKSRAPRRRRAPIERVDGRRAAPLLWAKTLAGVLESMDGEMTAPRRAMAHTACSLMIRLGRIDAEVAEGREPTADHVRLAGQLDRTLRSLGIVESGSSLSETGAMAGGGASSAQKKAAVPTMSLREEMEAAAEARWEAMTDDERQIKLEDDDDQERHDAWRRERDRRIERGEPILPEPRNPYKEHFDQAHLKRKIENKKSFTSHSDSSRSDE